MDHTRTDPDVLPPTEPGPSAGGGYPRWVERLILPFVREESLWPVLVAILGHVLVGQLFLLRAALRDRQLPALLALAGMLYLSAQLVLAERRAVRRVGPITGAICATWGLAAIGAWFLRNTEVF